jgi:hypothetical protein
MTALAEVLVVSSGHVVPDGEAANLDPGKNKTQEQMTALAKVLAQIQDWRLNGRDAILTEAITDFVSENINFLEDPFRQRLTAAGYFHEVVGSTLDREAWNKLQRILESYS